MDTRWLAVRFPLWATTAKRQAGARTVALTVERKARWATSLRRRDPGFQRSGLGVLEDHGRESTSL